MNCIDIHTKWWFKRKKHISILLMLLLSYLLAGQHEKIDSLEMAIKKHVSAKSQNYKDSTYVTMLLDLGQHYEFVKPDSLLKLSQTALQISDEINFLNGKQRAFTQMGFYYSDLGMHQKAISFFNTASKYTDSLNDVPNKVSLLNDLGLEYTYSGNFEKALKSYLEGLDMLQSIKEGDMQLESILNENIAQLYVRQNELKTALDFYGKAKKINDEIGDDFNSACAMVSHSRILSKTGNHEEAMFQINQCIAVFERIKDYGWLAFAYTNKGNIYLNQKKYKWAIYWYEQSSVLHQNLEHDRGRLQLLNGMSKAYLAMNMDSIAAKYASEGFTIARKIKSLEGLLNSSKTLYALHKKEQNYDKALEYHELYQKISDSISQDENKKGLALLKTKLKYDQQKKDLIAQNEKELAKQRVYIYVSVVILFILLATLIPLYLNQKKQKSLNKKLKNSTHNLKQREEELNGINKTKDKLFSIIGHDLRGPIGALQGVLKLFTSGDINKDDFLKFVPKLKTDVDHTLFTLNNLLTWGYSQMNGTRTRPKVTSIANLVDNNINLLSELSAAKSIKILSQLPEKPMGFIDENQIDVVLRNLISNAIKFTPNNGLITIGAQPNKDKWLIMVKDTGVGMDQKTAENLFNDGGSNTTYGTNNEKGTGLGLSLCHEMITNNGGQIWVESVPKMGSTFFFTVPKVEKKFKKAS